MHATELNYVAKVMQGDTPSAWGTGDEKFMQAKVVAAIAWHAIKDPLDPELPACDLTHQEKLVAEVEDLITGSTPSESSAFGREASRILIAIREAQHAALNPNTEEVT